MDKSKHNLRSNFLLLLLAISSFSLSAQKQTTANKTTTKTNSTQTGTTQTNTNTSTTNRRLILQSSTADLHQVREITPNGAFQIDNGSTYGDNVHTSAGGDLSSNGSSSAITCPMMQVQVSIPFLQSCINSSAQINYCNNGTATAFDAFVDVELPAELVLDSADLAYTIIGTNLYRFQLGTVAIAACNQFEVYFTTDCDSNLIGEEHCIQAHIYPDTLCDAPLITVDATCVAGKTNFTLNNHGTAVTIDQHMQLVIIEDHLIIGGSTPPPLVDDTLVLPSGGTFARGFTPGQDDYKLELIDGAGNQLVLSTVKNCYAGSPNILINTTHAHQDANQFGNSILLPSIGQGCAINGQATTQTSSTFAPPTNPALKPNGGSNDNNKARLSDLEFLDTEETTVRVFPNPFSQQATVRIEGPISNRFLFRLYDATGRTVQMIEIEGQSEFQIERGNLLQGMYLYQIESKGTLIDAGKLIIK